MKSFGSSVLVAASFFFASCDNGIEQVSDDPQEAPVTTISITGQAVIKVLPTTNGWLALKEIPKPTENFTAPLREISWMNGSFKETSNYKPAEEWSLIDVVVHPSGEASAVLVDRKSVV